MPLAARRAVQVAVTLAAAAVVLAALTTGALFLFFEPPTGSDVKFLVEYLPRSTTPSPLPPPESPGASSPASDSHPAVTVFPEAATPRDLAGTEVDGRLELGPDGHFQPTAEAIRLFRYFQTASATVDRARLRERIEAEIDSRLAPVPAGEAKRLLAQYLDYVDATRSLAPAGLDPRDLAGRLERVHELQRSTFGDELAARLFGPENDAASAALERLVARADPTLEPAQRDERLAASESSLPDGARVARERATSAADEAQSTADLRSQGATEDVIRASRERAVGADAADRLDDLDLRRADWESRLAAYRVQRDRVLADHSLTPEQRVDALDRLREERFSGDEVRHVAELDRLDALMPNGGAP